MFEQPGSNIDKEEVAKEAPALTYEQILERDRREFQAREARIKEEDRERKDKIRQQAGDKAARIKEEFQREAATESSEALKEYFQSKYLAIVAEERARLGAIKNRSATPQEDNALVTLNALKRLAGDPKMPQEISMKLKFTLAGDNEGNPFAAREEAVLREALRSIFPADFSKL